MEQETGGRQIKYLNKKQKQGGRNMFQNWIQMYIAVHMVTRSSTATQAILSKIGGKGTRNNQRRKKT